jgi:hypothetical protein
MKTDDTKGEYVTETDASDAIEMPGRGYVPAVVIERPRKAYGINDSGLKEFQLAGWVKMSARFCLRIKELRGAKLAIWLCISLNIDESGECNLTQNEICKLTGYSRTEIIDSLSELDDMGLLSVDRSGRRNMYRPVYVAKGKGNDPHVQKLNTSKVQNRYAPLDSNESSQAREKIVPTSSKKEKEGVPPIVFEKANKKVDFILKATLFPKAIQDAIRDHFRLTPRWENRYEREWMQWAMGERVTPEQVKVAAEKWRSDKRFNWTVPTLKGILEHWLELIERPASEESDEWRTL